MPLQPPPTFGRRARQVAAPLPAAAPKANDALAMGEAAALFRDSLATSAGDAHDGFAQWKRGRDTRRLAAWLATLALLSPGAICFVMQAPGGVSVAVEVLGVAANAWLRRRRRDHLLAIKTWSPADENPGASGRGLRPG